MGTDGRGRGGKSNRQSLIDNKSAVEKMKTDFAGALEEWGKRIQTWMYV